MTELKPCPFCGGEVTIHIGMMGLRFFRCDGCGAVVSFDSDYCNRNPKEAENAWNRRVTAQTCTEDSCPIEWVKEGNDG